MAGAPATWSAGHFFFFVKPLTIKALDAATGKIIWTVEKAQPALGWSAGFLAKDVFLAGSLDGILQGYNISDGSIVYKMKAAGPIGSALVVVDNTLFIGEGVPRSFSQQAGKTGLFAYQAGQ